LALAREGRKPAPVLNWAMAEEGGDAADLAAGRPARRLVGPVNDLGEADFQHLYGRWRGLEPGAVGELLAEAPFRWWIAGGHAIEAAGAAHRAHRDTDVAVLKNDVAAVRAWLSGFHLWEAHDGTLRPLLEGDELQAGREQLWMRRDASGPWLLDLVFSPSSDIEWVYKRDERIRRPFDEVGFLGGGGLPCLRPELVLLFKAKNVRPKDDADFTSVLPALGIEERRWLLSALQLTVPACPWILRLLDD